MYPSLQLGIAIWLSSYPQNVSRCVIYCFLDLGLNIRHMLSHALFLPCPLEHRTWQRHSDTNLTILRNDASNICWSKTEGADVPK